MRPITLARLPLALLALAWPGASQAGAFPDRLLILDQLENRNFDTLDRLLNALQERSEADIGQEIYASFAYETFQESNLQHEALLGQWLAAKPQSYAARVAAGEYFYHLGTVRRGGKWSDETSSEQRAGMNAAFDQALGHAKAALSLHPGLGEAYYLQMQIAMFRGDERLEQALAQEGLKAVRASFRLRRSYLQSLLPRWGGSYGAMETFAQDSQAHAAQNPRLKQLLGLIAWDQGSLAVLDKDYGTALALFTAALKAGEYASFYADRADTYLRIREYGKALADADAALALYPQVPGVLRDRAWALFSLDRAQEAVADLAAAARLDPGEADVAKTRDAVAEKLVAKAAAAQDQGRHDAALTLYGQALSLVPGSHDAYYGRGRAYLQQGQLGPAQADLEQALRLRPGSFEAAQSLDWLLAQDSRWDAIVAVWSRFLEADPGNANAYLERAGARRRQGEMAAALDDLQTACRLGNGNACRYLPTSAPR